MVPTALEVEIAALAAKLKPVVSHRAPHLLDFTIEHICKDVAKFILGTEEPQDVRKDVAE